MNEGLEATDTSSTTLPVEGHTQSIETKRNHITRSSVVAMNLGLVRNPEEKKTTYLRTFEKPLIEFDVTAGNEVRTLTGYQTFSVEDTRDYNGEGGERIMTGVRVGGIDSRYYREVPISALLQEDSIRAVDPVVTLPENMKELGDNVFSKKVMQTAGYDQVLRLIKAGEESGYFTDQMDALAEEMRQKVSAYYDRVTNVLIPNVLEHFPEYSIEDMDFFNLAPAVFKAPPLPGRKTPRQISILFESKRILVEYLKKTFGEKPYLYTVHPPFDTMTEGGLHASWYYNPEDPSDRDQVLASALGALREDMAKNNTK